MPSKEFRFSHYTSKNEKNQEVAILQVGGEIMEPSTGNAFNNELDNLLNSKAQMIVLDLRELTFISSLAMGGLVRFLPKLGDRPCIAYRPNPNIYKLFRIIGLFARMKHWDNHVDWLEKL